ncbi:MAG: hypothetical protein ACYDBT_02690 [Desulfobulbaceae bacterium]
MTRVGPFFLLLFLFSVTSAFFPTTICSAETSKAELDFPTLEQQLAASIDPDSDLQQARRRLADYYNQNDVEMVKGFGLILQEEVYSYWSATNTKKKNYALTLLVHLLANGAAIPGDTMTIALAVANNYIYSIADEPTRKQIKKDLINHFEYYKRIRSWQKTMNIRYDLARAPVIPKVYWAHRQRNLDLFSKISTLHLDQYLEFVDTIENLELMHDIITKNTLAQADSLIAIARNIEQFTEKNLLYRAKIDQHQNKLKRYPDDNNARQALLEYEKGEYTVDFMGQKRRWDLFYWLNYQVRLYKKFGYFKGDCVTETTFQMNLYKAAGIPAMANQERPVIKGGYSHNSPLFFNAFFNKWDSIQIPQQAHADYYLHFEKPIWHHLRYEKDGDKHKRTGREISSSYWQGEKASRNKIVSFRRRGYVEEDFEKLFLSDTTQQPGFILNSLSAPDRITDTDHDGILDEFEIGKNTDRNNADTDQEGVADLWEIEWSFNPADPSSRPQDDTIAIDGLAARESRSLKLVPVKDPANDALADSEVYDIASVAAKQLEKKIYIAIRFHNNIRTNSRDVHTLRVAAETGKEQQRMAFQWVRGKIYTYEITKKGWIKQECNQQDFSINTTEDTEMIIPLSYFTNYDILKIRYQATGLKRGKAKNNSDLSEDTTIYLKKSK